MVAVVAVLVVAGLALVACGSRGEAATTDGSTPRAGGTFNYPLSANPVSIEPLNAQESAGMQVAHQVFQGLVKYVINGDGEMVAEPDIAEKWETTDSQTWIFTLRRGVTFQPPVNREVTAQDFVASWNRATDPKNKSYVSYILAPIGGCDDRGYQVDPEKGLTGVRAIGDYTLEVKLRYPFADLPMALGHTVAAVSPVEYIERVGDKEYARKPVGTGPYMVESWKDDRSIQLVKNPSYWNKDEAGHVDRISLPIIADTSTMWLEFQKGNLDCSSVPPDQVRAAETDPRVESGQWNATSWPRLAVYFIGINMRDQMLGESLGLRQALAEAADAQSVVSMASDGVPLLASGYVPEGVVGHRAGQNPYAYDPDGARAIVEGLGEVPKLSYWYGTSEYGQRVARVLKAGWKTAGIAVEPRGFEGPTLLDRLLNADPGDGIQLFGMGYIADYPSMDNFLYPLFQSDQSGMGSFTGYSNQQVDEVLLEARETEDAQQRQNLYAQAEKLILADMPAIPLTGYRDFLVTDDRIAGFVHDPMGYTNMWDVWVK